MNESQLPAKLEDVLSQKVMSRLNEELSTLVPEETLTAIVRGHVDSWLKDDLPKLIKRALEEKVGKIVKGEIDQIGLDGWQEMRGEGVPVTINAEFIETLVKDHTQDLVAGMFSTIIKSAAQQAANNIRTGVY